MDKRDESDGDNINDDLDPGQLQELAEEWERVMCDECTAVRKMDPRLVYQMLSQIL